MVDAPGFEASNAPATLDWLAEGIARWSPERDTLKEALPLRAAARYLAPSLPSRAPRDDRERGLFAVLSAYQSPRGLRPERLLRDENLAASFAPMIGDPFLFDGPWPFEDPLHIADDSARAWLAIVGRYAPPSDAVRRFVRILFRARRRDLWTHASVALARLALRDVDSLHFLSTVWNDSFPNGPQRWGSGLVEPRSGRRNEAHAARHALHAACAFLGRGGAVAGLGGAGASEILSAGLPSGNPSDASVVLGGWLELARHPSFKPLVASRLEALAPTVPAEPQSEAALRALGEFLGADPSMSGAARACLGVLAKPRWRELRAASRVDALWSWLESARAFAAAGEAATVRAMQDASGEAGKVLGLLLGERSPGDGEAVDAFLGHLRSLLDPDVFATTPDAQVAVAIVEAIVLLESNAELAAMPWSALAVRAKGRAPTTLILDGPAGEVAGAALAVVVAARMESPPAVLLRDVKLPRDAVLRTAAHGSGFVARQIAVQLERLIREAPSGAQQVQLIWELLRKDPPWEVFEQLHDQLRCDEGKPTALHELIATLRRLDQLRHGMDRASVGPPPRVEIATAFSNLARAVAAVEGKGEGSDPGDPAPLGSAAGRLAEANAALAEALAALPTLVVPDVAPQDSGPPTSILERERSTLAREMALLAAVQAMVVAETEEASPLRAWLSCVEPSGPEREARLAALDAVLPIFRRLGGETQALIAAAPAAAREQVASLATAVADLARTFPELAWPEGMLLTRALDRVQTLQATFASRARRSDRASARYQRLLASADEDELVRLVRANDPDLEWLPPGVAQRLGEYFLDLYLFKEARGLRQIVQGRAAIGRPVSRLAPFAAVIAGGMFLWLDIGIVWNDILRAGTTGRMAVLVGLCLAFCYFALYTDFSARSRSRPLRLVRRTTVVFGCAYGFSIALNALALWTLEGTPLRPTDFGALSGLQLLLWSSFSLFFGVVVDRFMHGRSALSVD